MDSDGLIDYNYKLSPISIWNIFVANSQPLGKQVEETDSNKNIFIRVRADSGYIVNNRYWCRKKQIRYYSKGLKGKCVHGYKILPRI